MKREYFEDERGLINLYKVSAIQPEMIVMEVYIESGGHCGTPENQSTAICLLETLDDLVAVCEYAVDGFLEYTDADFFIDELEHVDRVKDEERYDAIVEKWRQSLPARVLGCVKDARSITDDEFEAIIKVLGGYPVAAGVGLIGYLKDYLMYEETQKLLIEHLRDDEGEPIGRKDSDNLKLPGDVELIVKAINCLNGSTL